MTEYGVMKSQHENEIKILWLQIMGFFMNLTKAIILFLLFHLFIFPRLIPSVLFRFIQPSIGAVYCVLDAKRFRDLC